MSGRHLRGVIFDFDGVILESADIKTLAFLELFAAYPQHQQAILDYHLAHQGISRYVKFEWIYRELLQQPFTDNERARLGDAFGSLVLDRVIACPFVPGALELLEALQDVTLCFVASGTPQHELRDIVRRRGLERFFRGVWGTPTGKPEIVRRLLAETGALPGEFVFVGDGTSDYEAARACDVPFVARDTPAVSAMWRALEVPRVADMRELAQLLQLPSASADG